MQRMSKYRVDDVWINCEMTYLKKRMKFDDSDAVLTTETSVPILFALLEEIKERRKAEKEQGHTDHSASEKDGAEMTQEKAVLPIPCTKGSDDWTVKECFQKVNEELDELKEAVLSRISGFDMNMCDTMYEMYEAEAEIIAEEAADTITAITSMLEAMGIDEQQRQAAQRRVNERNKERGRL